MYMFMYMYMYTYTYMYMYMYLSLSMYMYMYMYLYLYMYMYMYIYISYKNKARSNQKPRPMTNDPYERKINKKYQKRTFRSTNNHNSIRKQPQDSNHKINRKPSNISTHPKAQRPRALLPALRSDFEIYESYVPVGCPGVFWKLKTSALRKRSIFHWSKLEPWNMLGTMILIFASKRSTEFVSQKN